MISALSPQPTSMTSITPQLAHFSMVTLDADVSLALQACS